MRIIVELYYIVYIFAMSCALPNKQKQKKKKKKKKKNNLVIVFTLNIRKP